MNKKTIFNLEWTDRDLNPQWSKWIEAVKSDPYKARCRFCLKTFSLSNMGRQAIYSHEKSSKHMGIIKARETSVLKLFGGASTSAQGVCTASNNEQRNDLEIGQLKPSSSLEKYVTKEKTVAAEILWAMKLVMSHSSYNSFKDVANIFVAMFPDSEIAKSVSLGSTKMAYLISFGLAPYFHSQLLKEIASSYFVLCVDEALNAVAQKKQMDLIVRYWPENSDQVKVRFLNSVFLGHSTAEDLFDKFCEGSSDLNLQNLLQISMDGPNVNHKFWRHLCDEVKATKGFTLLNIGTCSLHIVHRAFQIGNGAVTWKLNTIFQAMYRLFKNSPARRADFISATNSDIFPLKFCQIRWVENVVVAERALDIFPKIKVYLKAAKKDLPMNVSVGTLKEASEDKLIYAKISFFISVASILEPFLKSFQNPAPMVPFLYNALSDVLRQIMSRFVKPELLRQASTPSKLMKIEIKSAKVHRRNEELDVGIAARSYLKKSSASDTEKNGFLSECKNFLVKMTEKIIEKSPVNFSMVRSLSCMDPLLIASNPVLCENRMDVLLQLLHDNNILPALKADHAKLQFSIVTQKVKTEWKDAFSSYSRKETRLDSFFSSFLKNKEEFQELWTVVKIILTLSHGNASVESGFSINKDFLVENLHEESLVALRTTYDAVKSLGGPLSVNITPEILQSARLSRSRYHMALDEKKRCREKVDKAENERKRTLDQIKVLQQKRAKLATEMDIQSQKLEEEIIELKKKVL